jgi:hypothetical protein
MLETAAPAVKPSSRVKASAPNSRTHYRKFELGQFSFERDEYFVTIGWSAKGARQQHRMSADAFLRALMRDVAWGFFYGWVNFDAMFGTRNLYGRVQFCAGRYNEATTRRGCPTSKSSTRQSPWKPAAVAGLVHAGFDPFALRRPGRPGRNETRRQYRRHRTISWQPNACPDFPVILRCETTCR